MVRFGRFAAQNGRPRPMRVSHKEQRTGNESYDKTALKEREREERRNANDINGSDDESRAECMSLLAGWLVFCARTQAAIITIKLIDGHNKFGCECNRRRYVYLFLFGSVLAARALQPKVATSWMERKRRWLRFR